MPIKAEMRWFYPIDWPQISRHVRFERAGGICEGCGRPHGETIRCLPDGRWFDAAHQTWRNDRGRLARWPDIEEATRMRQTRVVLAAAHLDHNPGNNRPRNLKSLCQRCHHDRPHHLARRRITYLLRRALGDCGRRGLWCGRAAASATEYQKIDGAHCRVGETAPRDAHIKRPDAGRKNETRGSVNV